MQLVGKGVCTGCTIRSECVRVRWPSQRTRVVCQRLTVIADLLPLTTGESLQLIRSHSISESETQRDDLGSLGLRPPPQSLCEIRRLLHRCTLRDFLTSCRCTYLTLQFQVLEISIECQQLPNCEVLTVEIEVKNSTQLGSARQVIFFFFPRFLYCSAERCRLFSG